MRRRENVHPANARSLRAAAARLRKGELVAFPTETVYGLGANALDETAVAKIFARKGRPHDNPMIVHVSDRKMLRRVIGRMPPLAARLAGRFWPGPLTLILSKKSSIPSSVTAGLDTVAVRMPQGLARDLVRLAGVPIAAPSANVSGRPSPTTAQHVAEDFPDLYVLDGGPTAHGLESTVLALEPHPVVLRQGAVTEEQLREFLPRIRGGGGARRRPRAAAPSRTAPAASPGTKYTHYAPGRPLILFLRKSSLLSYAKAHPKALVLSFGDSPEEIARNLFAALRTRRRGTELLALAIPRRGVGRAVMDRLTRAATRIVP